MNKKGVSAVIGVFLMVAITVAIASVVYVYVSGIYNLETQKIYGQANITDKYVIDGQWNVEYYFELDGNETKEVSLEIYRQLEIGDVYTWYVDTEVIKE